jgi:hypothetical protein
VNKVGGRIAAVGSLNGDMTAKGKMSGKVKSAETKPLPEYEGEYVIDPKFEDITLETKKKSLYDDVTVKAITTLEVDNEAGGITVIIGI